MSDQHLIFSLQYPYNNKQTSDENKKIMNQGIFIS